jgi:hypothetical protein
MTVFVKNLVSGTVIKPVYERDFSIYITYSNSFTESRGAVFHLREVSGSIFDPEAGYHYYKFSWISSVSSGKYSTIARQSLSPPLKACPDQAAYCCTFGLRDGVFIFS